MSTKLRTALCTMTAVWKRRVEGNLVFKFQKQWDVCGASYTRNHVIFGMFRSRYIHLQSVCLLKFSFSARTYTFAIAQPV